MALDWQIPDLPSDSDDKGKLGLSWDIVVSNFAGCTGQANLTPVHLPVLLVILLSPLVDEFSGHFARLIEENHVRATTTTFSLTFQVPQHSKKYFVPSCPPATS